MKFIDIIHHTEIELIEIELSSPLTCKLVVLDNNLKWLEGTGKVLNGYIREAPLDGNPPAHFAYSLNLAEKRLTITGNVIEAIKALHAYKRISDKTQDAIVMHIVTEMNKQAFKAISAEAQSIFIGKIQTAILSPPHSPTLFSH